MELLQLRYFLEVARTQHMTRSAEKLHIAQPSLTQAIRRLEDELGVKLFVRKGRNIVLTDCGKALQQKLEPILEKLDALPEQLLEIADPERTTIRLHVAAASVFVTEAIVEYQKMHDRLNFQFLLNEDDELCDISIGARLMYQQGREDPDRFVCSEEIFLAVPNTPEFAGCDETDLAEFRDRGFISLLNSKQFRLICDRFCSHAGFTPRILFESDNPDSVRNMIAANMGVGFWPAHTWGTLNHEKIRLLRIREPVCQRSIIITRNRNRIDNRIVDSFFQFLSDFFAERLAE